MIFNFLRYLQPTHYFQLNRKNGASVFPIVSEISNSIVNQLQTDINFKSSIANQYDLSWQAIQKGYIGDTETYKTFQKLPIIDEYRFIRKYFHPAWVLYVLLLRLVSFYNPLKEINAWRKSKNTTRSVYLKAPILYEDWTGFDSSLLIEKPFVSVIIPTLNRYIYLKDVLDDLAKQHYTNFEVIVVDQSSPFQEVFYEQFNLDITLIYQKERALWLARNRAIELAKGEFILLFDDDSRVEPNWIENHLKCIDYFKAEVSSGISISKIGALVPANYCFFKVSDQIDTGNVLIKKQVFREIGLFDRQFEKQRMGDGEFGLRCFLNSYKNISNPYAGRIHLKVGSGGLREMGSWDAFRTKKWFSPRPIPSVLYLFRKYYGNNRARFALLKTVPPSIIPYRFKKNRKLLLVGVFVSILLLPLILIQVAISWRASSKKITQGAYISEL